MTTIAMMYVSLLSAILAGVMNSVFCHTSLLKVLKIPMDGGKSLGDGNRIFGDNKTWKGFIGYIVLNAVFALITGYIFKLTGIESYSFFYVNNANTPLFNLGAGALVGFFYALFELPNSFLKRRLGIVPGKTLNGFKKWFFVFLDQADSIFGICLVIWFFYPLGIGLYLLYVLVGAGTHIILNMLLYFAGVRKNMF